MWYKIKQWNNFWFLFYVSRIGNNYSVDEIFYCYSMLWICLTLTHFIPLISFDTPWNIRKLLVFWCFQGVLKEISSTKWVIRRTRKLDFYYWFILCHRSPFILSVFQYSVVINIESIAEGSTYFMPLVSFYTPLKTLENQRLSDVFRGYRKTSDMI